MIEKNVIIQRQEIENLEYSVDKGILNPEFEGSVSETYLFTVIAQPSSISSG